MAECFGVALRKRKLCYAEGASVGYVAGSKAVGEHAWVQRALLADLDVPLVALRTFDASQQACLACDPVSQPYSLQPAMSAHRRLAAVAVPGRNRDAFGF